MESRVRLSVGPLGAVLVVALVAAFVAPAALAAPTAIRVKDINPGAGHGGFGPFVNMGGTLYFYGDDGEHGGELWKSDGTAASSGARTAPGRGRDSSGTSTRAARSRTLIV